LLGDCPEIKGEAKRKNRKMTCLIHLVPEDMGPKGVKPQEAKNMVVMLSANHPDFRIDIENTSSGFPIIQDAEGEHILVIGLALGAELNGTAYFTIFSSQHILTENIPATLISLVVDRFNQHLVIVVGVGLPDPHDSISYRYLNGIIFIGDAFILPEIAVIIQVRILNV
jgi:hypothetical protein